MNSRKLHSSGRHGSCLEHGCAHADDHRRWSRRDFMAGLGLAAGSTMMLGSTPVHAMVQSPLLHGLGRRNSERILVLLQLNGGNDGLNTIIPVDDDRYYQVRPTLAIPKTAALPFANTLHMHPSMAQVRPLFDNGEMAIVRGVGYEDSSLSHFRGTDVWLTGSGSDEYLNTGWSGRQLEIAYPRFEQNPLDYPLAVQIGGTASQLFDGSVRNLGMALANSDSFQRLATSGQFYDERNLPATPYGSEMAYVRRVANDTFRYGAAVQAAASKGRNSVSYPQIYENWLARSLSIVARLIKGELGSRIYHVGLGGFDTHGTQGGVAGRHSLLLRYLAQAVRTFLTDLGPLADQVLIMTFSEFGRRVEQNGSDGTDHGTAAPVFLFGPGARGGVYGDAPSLTDLDGAGNMKHGIDFRAVYATVLQHWFGFVPQASERVLGHEFAPLDFIRHPANPVVTRTEHSALPDAVVLGQNYPNPFNPYTMIPFSLRETASVRIDVLDAAGRHVRTLVDRSMPAGRHEVRFEAAGLASGVYICQLRAGGVPVSSRRMTLVR